MTSGILHVLRRALTLAAFRLLRLIFTLVQRVYWQLNGTAQQLRDAQLPQNYERSAQVINIMLHYKFCELQTTTFEEFVCSHERMVSPRYVIDNENVTLLRVDDDRAIFVQAKGQDMQLWRSKFCPFIRLAQLLYCDKLIIMPMSSFHRLAEEIGDPPCEIIFIFNTGRCGSTLLTQVFEYTGRCVALSEPDSANIVAAKYRQTGDTPELRQLARDVIRLECRPYKSFQPPPLAYAIKVTAPSTVAIPFFRELFPRGRNLFMYRDIVRVSKSLYRVSYQWPTLCLVYVLGSLSGSLTESAVDAMGFCGKDFNMRLDHGLTLGVLLNIVTMQAYLDLRRKGFDVRGVRYEDLVGQPLESCRRILEYCGLAQDLAPSGVKGLDNDSQRNTALSRTALASFPEPQLTADVKSTLNSLIRKYPGIPLLGDECVLEGTITYGDGKN